MPWENTNPVSRLDLTYHPHSSEHHAPSLDSLDLRRRVDGIMSNITMLLSISGEKKRPTYDLADILELTYELWSKRVVGIAISMIDWHPS